MVWDMPMKDEVSDKIPVMKLQRTAMKLQRTAMKLQ